MGDRKHLSVEMVIEAINKIENTSAAQSKEDFAKLVIAQLPATISSNVPTITNWVQMISKKHADKVPRLAKEKNGKVTLWVMKDAVAAPAADPVPAATE